MIYVTWSRGMSRMCGRYCFWDIGKERVQNLMFYIVFSIDKVLITRHPFLMGFASKYRMFKLPESARCKNLNIHNLDDMQLISFDRVTYAYVCIHRSWFLHIFYRSEVQSLVLRCLQALARSQVVSRDSLYATTVTTLNTDWIKVWSATIRYNI